MSGNVQPLFDFDLIVPIPLHGSRLYERGFNQALLLADRVGDRFSIPVCYDNLVRTRPTRPQVELSGLDRVKNVAGAFSLVTPHAIKNSRILLVDDVFTTGATMNECASVLKTSGARYVAALTLARAV
jgi:ComF family protein